MTYPTTHASRRATVMMILIAALFLQMSTHAAITVLGTDSAVTAANSSPGEFSLSSGIYSYAFNAGAASDMLVVSVSTEASSEAWSVSYGGVEMTLATQSSVGSGTSIFYLANPSATGTVAIDFSAKGTVNGVGLGIASLGNSGQPIYFNNGVSDTGTASINITTNHADSFVMFAGDANSTAGANPTLGSPLTSVRSGSWPSDIGSNTAAAGYEDGVAAGSNTYSWTQNASPRGISAAAFSTIPEPSSLTLIALGGLFLLRRKRSQ